MIGPALSARAAAGVTPALVDAFARDGAVCVRQLLVPEEVALIRRGIDANLAAPSPRAIVASAPGDPGHFVEDFCNWQVNEDYRRAIFETPLAAAAGLLAHVREADERSLPVAMSQRDGDKPRVSALRFRRLLEAPDVDTLFTGLRRTLPLLQHRADPLALTTDVVNWGDRVRKRWAYDYDWPEQKAAA